MFRAILKILCIIIVLQVTHQAKKPKSAVITDLEDMKEFRKILRTKTNVLVLFIDSAKSSRQVADVFRETADGMKGQATLVMFECNTSNDKKFCKKLKSVPEKDQVIIKHYKDGHFNREYDRDMSVSSMTNFLRDPTGDLPWEEDPTARSVAHLATPEWAYRVRALLSRFNHLEFHSVSLSLTLQHIAKKRRAILKETPNEFNEKAMRFKILVKFFKSGAGAYKRTLVMFYAPWCTYCKIMKPDYVQAATELKGVAILAAIDVAKPGNSNVRQHFNVTGFPTLLYFERGQPKYQYSGENKKQAIVDFMKNPQPPQKKPEVKEESWSQDTDVVHLTSENFDSIISKAEKALVVFYAPWCGHCKKIKPELEKAATRMIKENIDGVLAVVDATKEGKLATKFGVKGYPTLKYFSRGDFKFEAGDARKEDDIINFMKNPQAAAPPPAPERPWSEEESLVKHLGLPTFKNALRKVKHAIVMFYAPWCGHCKTTKPEFTKAAETFADELLVAFGAVDCTLEQELCANYDVKGYPTLKYFSFYDRQVKDYTGGRKAEDFVSFINSHVGTPSFSTKTPTSQEAGFGGNVKILSDENFENTIGQPTLTLVMFYATWCDHCTSSKPAYSKVATAMKESGTATVVAIDAANNPKTADFAKIETLPTYKIYQSGKELALYSGDRSEKSLIDFIQQHKVKDEL